MAIKRIEERIELNQAEIDVFIAWGLSPAEARKYASQKRLREIRNRTNKLSHGAKDRVVLCKSNSD